MLLKDIKVGHWARILSLQGEACAYRNRLITFGLIPGACFKVLRRAPLGDPILLLIRGGHLILRQSEAAILNVEPYEI